MRQIVSVVMSGGTLASQAVNSWSSVMAADGARRSRLHHRNVPRRFTLQQPVPANSNQRCRTDSRGERLGVGGALRASVASFHLVGQPWPVAGPRDDADRDELLIRPVDRALEPLAGVADRVSQR